MIKIGEASVDAKVWWGDTQISIQSGHVYQLRASGVWYDASIRCGPAGYDLSSVSPLARPLFKLFGWLRPLDTGECWYMLLGRIGADGPVFEIGESLDLAATLSGTLYCTVNDIRLMYYNNSGTVNLEVFDTTP